MIFDGESLGRTKVEVLERGISHRIGTVKSEGLDLITDQARRAEVAARLAESGREIVPLTNDQIGAFAGNAIELMGRDGPILALSQRAFDAMDATQKSTISELVEMLPIPFATIESAGGSVRCAIAGIHLSRR